MRNITITAYDYNELTGQAKQRAYNTLYEIILDCVNDCFYEDTKNDLCDRFCNSILDLQYDFSNSQGSGLNIYGDFDLRDYLPHYQASEKIKRTIAFYIDVLRKYNCFDALNIKLSENHRYTYSCKFIDIKDAEYIVEEIAEELKNNYIKNIKIDILVDFIKAAYEYIEKQEDIIFANGEKVFDICDNDVQEYCAENDIAFDASGRIIWAKTIKE